MPPASHDPHGAAERLDALGLDEGDREAYRTEEPLPEGIYVPLAVNVIMTAF